MMEIKGLADMMTIRGSHAATLSLTGKLSDLMAMRRRLPDLMAIKETCRLDGIKRETC